MVATVSKRKLNWLRAKGLLISQIRAQLRDYQQGLQKDFDEEILILSPKEVMIRFNVDLIKAVMSAPQLGRGHSHEKVLYRIGMDKSLHIKTGAELTEAKTGFMKIFGPDWMSKHRPKYAEIFHRQVKRAGNWLDPIVLDRILADTYLSILNVKNYTDETVDMLAEMIVEGRKYLNESIKSLSKPPALSPEQVKRYLRIISKPDFSEAHYLSNTDQEERAQQFISMANGMGTSQAYLAAIIHSVYEHGLPDNAVALMAQAIDYAGMVIPGATHEAMEKIMLKDFIYEDGTPVTFEAGTVIHFDLSSIIDQDILAQFAFGNFICGGWKAVVFLTKVWFELLSEYEIVSCDYKYVSGLEVIQQAEGSAHLKRKTLPTT